MSNGEFRLFLSQFKLVFQNTRMCGNLSWYMSWIWEQTEYALVKMMTCTLYKSEWNLQYSISYFCVNFPMINVKIYILYNPSYNHLNITAVGSIWVCLRCFSLKLLRWPKIPPLHLKIWNISDFIGSKSSKIPINNWNKISFASSKHSKRVWIHL